MNDALSQAADKARLRGTRMSSSIKNIVISTLIISGIAVNELRGNADAAELTNEGRRGNPVQRRDEINGQLAGGASTSVYIEIAGSRDAPTAYGAGEMAEIKLVRYDEAQFTTRYFADVERVPGIFPDNAGSD
ncbi:MAG: hypothetical protein HKO62_03480 [Gammaproteobacteria bacterium]|nr:hypothetical protein [Gammaproteobacteria bacterium]